MKCKRCAEDYALDHFQKSELRPVRGSQWCRKCVREYKRAWKEKRRREARVPVKVIKYLQMKVAYDLYRCRSCNNEKPSAEFSKSNLQPRGRGWCRECVAAHVRTNGAGRAVWEKAQAKYRNTAKARETLRLWRQTEGAKLLFRDRAIQRRVLVKTSSLKPRQMAAWYRQLYVFQKGVCAVCRTDLTEYQVDHIEPLAKGGKHEPDNIQLLCPTCNRRKNAKDPVRFMQERGYLI